MHWDFAFVPEGRVVILSGIKAIVAREPAILSYTIPKV